MIDSLFHAYTPLVIWPGLGFLLARFFPDRIPKLLGLALYWVGVPLQLLVLGHQTELSGGGELIPIVAVAALLLSMSLSLAIWWGLQRVVKTKAVEAAPDSQLKVEVRGQELGVRSQESGVRSQELGGRGGLFSFVDWTRQNLESILKIFSPSRLFSRLNVLGRASLGSFLLAAMLGNTGFIGLALAAVLFDTHIINWAVLFSVASNVAGNYGIAVFIASYFGNSETKNHWWIQLRDVLTVPSIWGFIIGFNTRSIKLPPAVESGLQQAVWVVIVFALLLVGLRLGDLKGWRSLERALLPTLLKVVIVPMFIGLGATFFGVIGDARLMLVLMSGTPTGLSVLILAEVYELDRELLASSIATTFAGMLLVLPFWFVWFG
jgi:predicted permease